MANHVVRAVQLFSLKVIGDYCDSAVEFRARHTAAIALAIDQPPQKIEDQAITTHRVTNFFVRLARRNAEQAGTSDVDEVEEAVGMPERTFGKDEPARDFFEVRGLQDVGQGFRRPTPPWCGPAWRQKADRVANGGSARAPGLQSI